MVGNFRHRLVRSICYLICILMLGIEWYRLVICTHFLEVTLWCPDLDAQEHSKGHDAREDDGVAGHPRTAKCQVGIVACFYTAKPSWQDTPRCTIFSTCLATSRKGVGNSCRTQFADHSNSATTDQDNFAIYGYAFVNFANHEQASKVRMGSE